MSRIIHNKGPKAERDRNKYLGMYNSYCRAFPWYSPISNEALKAMNNFQLHALCKSVWEEQTPRDQSTYIALCKSQPSLITKAPRPITYRSVPDLKPVDADEAPRGVPFVNA